MQPLTCDHDREIVILYINNRPFKYYMYHLWSLYDIFKLHVSLYGVLRQTSYTVSGHVTMFAMQSKRSKLLFIVKKKSFRNSKVT